MLHFLVSFLYFYCLQEHVKMQHKSAISKVLEIIHIVKQPLYFQVYICLIVSLTAKPPTFGPCKILDFELEMVRN